MTFKSALENSSDFLTPLKVKAPDTGVFRRAVNEISDQGESLLRPVTVSDIQDLVRRHFESGTLSSIKRRDLRFSPKGLFDLPSPFCKDRHLFDALLAEIENRAQRSAVIVAIFQYLEFFDDQHLEVRALGEWLDKMVTKWDWPWNTRATEYSLFQPSIAPERLALTILTNSQRADLVLEEIGLNSAAASGSFGEAAFKKACQTVEHATNPNIVTSQLKLIAWSKLGNDFAFPREFASFASALLSPWTQTEPEDEHRALLLSELESYAGDPRTRPAKWSAVQDKEPTAYSTLLRWLTKASVYQFFDIVDRTADENMWKYRRAFWTSYLEAGYIEQAWVVFGANGQKLAKQAARQSEDRGLMSFGKLNGGGGRSPDHAALVMKIGDVTIAEWSHNGRYNIWNKRDKLAPKLFQISYDPDELRGAPIEKSHIGAERYYWQSNVAADIRNATGLITPTSSWKPSKRKR